MENNLLEGQLLNNKVDVRQYSALNLAYIGDAVFEIYARTKVVKEYKTTVNNMNKKTNAYVNAKAQNEMYHKLLNIATEQEVEILKRGRNAKSKSSAKSATVSEYRHATGIEALVGFLYLSGNIKRLDEIFEYLLQ